MPGRKGHGRTIEERKEWRRLDRLAHPARYKAYEQQYMARYREKNGPREDKTWFLYGISYSTKQAMIDLQEGHCMICDVEMTLPHIDHDHETGYVRGILCPRCNLGLGYFVDSPDLLLNAARYLLLWDDLQSRHTSSLILNSRAGWRSWLSGRRVTQSLLMTIREWTGRRWTTISVPEPGT